MKQSLRQLIAEALKPRFLSGSTDSAIAREFGLGNASVAILRRMAGLPPSPKTRRAGPPKHERIPGEHPAVIRRIKRRAIATPSSENFDLL